MMLVFGDTQDGTWEVFLEVADHLGGRSHAVEPVLVGANPCIAVAADHHAGDCGIADDVTRS